MSRNFFVKFMVCLVIVAAAVLYLLSVVMPETFGFFSLAWAVVLLAGGLGVILILQGLFKKDITTLKKTKIWFGAGLLVVALFALVSAIALPNNLILPIIAVIVAAALLLGLLATGGKKWDEGDSSQVGYKNYFQRKKEEENQEKKDAE